MGGYIKRDALMAYTDNQVSKSITNNDIARFPAADVVEVVRCGQCVYWKINPNNLFGGYCRYSEAAGINHFCSYGERRIDNATD